MATVGVRRDPASASERLTALVAGWTREHTGHGYVLFPPGFADEVRIDVRQEVALRPMRRIVDGHVARARRLGRDDPAIGPLVRFTTFEGEHAGAVTLAAREPDGAVAELTLVLVVADDRCWIVEGHARGDEWRERVRELALLIGELAYVGRGELRRRRYEFTPPPRWLLLPHRTCPFLLHPLYPRRPARILVPHARPRLHAPSEVADRALTLQNAALVLEGQQSIAAGALEGVLVRYRVAGAGPPFTVVEALLADDRFTYRAVLEAPSPGVEEVALFERFARTIRPIPARRTAGDDSLAGMWQD